MFDCTEISETIYEGDVESPYKNTNRENANGPGHTRQNRGEYVLYFFNSKMGKQNCKRRQRYVDHIKEKLQLTCLIKCLGHSSDYCKVLEDVGYK